MGVNTKYKDSVFSTLFSEPETLRELYRVVEGVDLPPDVPISVNTLQDVIFMGRINDISFAAGGQQLVLMEHQSTINPNMALRILLYAARLYEKLTANKNIYGSKEIKLPRPEFFVLYNGTAPFPDEKEYRLSDMFEDTASLGIDVTGTPALEVIVKVLNINEGRNSEKISRCPLLKEYTIFIEKVREFEKELGDREEAMKAAVRYCREHNILKKFLEEHGTEVMNMLITEWDWDDALAVRFEEGVEKGVGIGVEKGLEKATEAFVRSALMKGYSIDAIRDITGLDTEAINSLSLGS